jgi:L-asparaginase
MRKINSFNLCMKRPITSRLGLLFILLLCAKTAILQAQGLPRVVVIATGGTIAGEQREPGTFGGYEIRKSVNEVVALVPEADKYAEIETEQFVNLPSPSITPEHWLQLSKRISEIFRTRPEVAGVVVTHGTSRLEETAYFLHLTIRSDKPVVLVGAQRPPTGISPDGPINLLSAVRLAAAPEARGKGTLVVMDERILSARDAHKLYERSGGFATNDMGMLGVVAAHGVEFFYQPTRRHTINSEFDIRNLTVLPRVDVEYSYAGAEGGKATAAKAIVVATTGFTPAERAYYEDLSRKGVIVAATFPSGDQVASASKDGFPIAVKRMLPLHARILLMLALTRTQDPREIQRIFDQY